jgi:hypothetical protein
MNRAFDEGGRRKQGMGPGTARLPLNAPSTSVTPRYDQADGDSRLTSELDLETT